MINEESGDVIARRLFEVGKGSSRKRKMIVNDKLGNF